MGEYIIAHDVGTSCNKALLVDKNGIPINSSIEPYPIYYPEVNFAEQDPDDWWKAVCKTTKDLIKKSGVKKEEIVGLTFSNQMLGIVPVNKSGKLRNAIIWLDNRAVKEADYMMKKFINSKIFALLAGAPLTGKDGMPKLLWLKNNEKDIYEKMEYFLDVDGYLIYKATGNMVMELSNASVFGIDLKKKDWLRWIFNYIGFNTKKLPPLVKSTDIVGKITKEAAIECGLLEGTPVIAGSGDALCSSVGAGAIDEGDTHVYLGTSGWIGVITKRHPTGKFGIAVIQSADYDKSFLFAETETAGECLRWIKEEFYRKESQDPEIKNVYALMDEEVTKVPPGSDFLIFTPWLYGERAPLNNCYVRAGFVNLCINHKRENLLRAVYEGVGYNIRWIIEVIESTFNFKIPYLRIIGGGAKGDIWMQIISDITQKRVEVLPYPQERGAIGAAFIGFIGLKYFEDFSSLKNILKIEKVFEPYEKNKKVYDFLYEKYKLIYKNLKKFYIDFNKEVEKFKENKECLKL